MLTVSRKKLKENEKECTNFKILILNCPCKAVFVRNYDMSDVQKQIYLLPITAITVLYKPVTNIMTHLHPTFDTSPTMKRQFQPITDKPPATKWHTSSQQLTHLQQWIRNDTSFFHNWHTSSQRLTHLQPRNNTPTTKKWHASTPSHYNFNSHSQELVCQP